MRYKRFRESSEDIFFPSRNYLWADFRGLIVRSVGRFAAKSPKHPKNVDFHPFSMDFHHFSRNLGDTQSGITSSFKDIFARNRHESKGLGLSFILRGSTASYLTGRRRNLKTRESFPTKIRPPPGAPPQKCTKIAISRPFINIFW